MDVLEILIKKLQEKEAQIVEFVASGKAIDFDNYAALVGEIRGIRYAMNEIQDLNEMITRQDNSDD